MRKAVAELSTGIVVKEPKTGASRRSMKIPKAMMDILAEHRCTWATGEYVFPAINDKNKPQAPSNLCRSYRKVLALAGIQSNFHELRHTNITNLIVNGVDIKTVKQRAGHSRVETTLSYTHPSEELDKKEGEIFTKWL